MSDRRCWRTPFSAALAALIAAPAMVLAQAPTAPTAPTSPPGAVAEAPPDSAAVPSNSVMDDRLFYQLLIGELALAQGDAGTAFEWLLDAARRTKDEGLFRRVTDVALQARAGDQALAASRAWRLARPESLDALRLQLQILMALNRASELAEPLRSLLEQTPAADRGGLIAALPRFLQRAGDAETVVSLMDEVLKPYRDAPQTRTASRVALGRAWLAAKDTDRALALAHEAMALDITAIGPPLLALELMRERPAAEALVLQYLAQEKAENALRLNYVRVLTGAQRYADAVAQLEAAIRAQPAQAQPYLTLGALHLELKHPKDGEAALLRYIDLVQRETPEATALATAPATAASAAASSDTSSDNEEADETRPDQGLVQAWLMLAQSAEQRGDFKAAEAWLAKIEDPQRALDVQSRRASILARQGRITQARELIRNLPERSPDDARAKVMAEAAVLREVKRWKDAFDVLGKAANRFADDADLLYEQAMVAEKLDRLDEMERLLRRVIAINPDNAHAHNALGYSLADRKLRLPEARALVQRALELSPGDPFITDSLGWIEYRLGNKEEAARLLRQAYAARPDTEIGAHLGEVLWALGQRDEARRIWRESKGRDAANDVLRETLARLRVDL
ncbi:MAG: tetratricopeptide repeat protein [Rubrivivax sp.]|nr:tetratricopeptide repeat protein [Rubrivivax sp.]